MQNCFPIANKNQIKKNALFLMNKVGEWLLVEVQYLNHTMNKAALVFSLLIIPINLIKTQSNKYYRKKKKECQRKLYPKNTRNSKTAF